MDPEHTNLITTARRINDKMPSVTVKKIRRAVAQYDNPNIIALGAAYKPNTDDQRNSPAQDIVESLLLDGYDIQHYDRHIDGIEYNDLRSLLNDERPDVLLQLVPHDDTINEINEIREWIDDCGIELLQFGESRTPSMSIL